VFPALKDADSRTVMASRGYPRAGLLQYGHQHRERA
jgi:hypothetical protein